jgi:HlyD family secretion protein
MSKKWWIIVGAVVPVIVVGIVGWQRSTAGNGAAQVSEEGAAVVQRGTLEVTVNATGSLAPAAEVLLAFSSGGRVLEVLVEEGEQVEAGQPLVRLEADELELQVAQAEAVLTAAEAQLAQLVVPPRPEEVAMYEANLRASQAQVSAAVANREQLTAGANAGQIAAAEAQVASTTAQQKSAEDMHERTLTCREVNLPDGTKKTICPALGVPEEQARYSLQAADASLAAAQAQLDGLLDGADEDAVRAAQGNVWAAAAQRDATQAQLEMLLVGATKEQIQTAQAAVDEARIALEQAQLWLEKATLAAPMAGTVSYLGVEPGEIVNANYPVVMLSALTALEVEINLDETDVTSVAVGQEAQLSMDAFPDAELAGKVVHIAPAAEVESGVVLFPVTIRLKPTDVPMRAGMTVDVTITTLSQEDALIVPLRAIETEGERAYVQRLVQGEFERVEVTLGLRTDAEIEITGGLAEGDVVSVVPGPIQGADQFEGPMSILRGNN